MLRVPRGRVCAKPDKSQIRCNRRQDPPPASPSALRLCESAAKGRRGAHWGRGSLSPSPTHRLTREWPAPSPVRLRPSAALPAAEFSPSVHRTLVVSRELQVFGVGVGVSVRAWVQWEAVREGLQFIALFYIFGAIPELHPYPIRETRNCEFQRLEELPGSQPPGWQGSHAARASTQDVLPEVAGPDGRRKLLLINHQASQSCAQPLSPLPLPRSRCVGPICAVSRTGSCSPGSTSVVTLPTGARSLGNDS
ncbi:unnamed protein product [Rangifer tarandus platyrhynchus]|uniref:Uncharacterized protein n=1 Tax=Rangifer tarandus platyrhynchus TaxID=3082113 RepID=A0ABN8XZ65_RANTA|nr:unnamed protein product [Rangifer tarandus platyrhynchus]